MLEGGERQQRDEDHRGEDGADDEGGEGAEPAGEGESGDTGADRGAEVTNQVAIALARVGASPP